MAAFEHETLQFEVLSEGALDSSAKAAFGTSELLEEDFLIDNCSPAEVKWLPELIVDESEGLRNLAPAASHNLDIERSRLLEQLDEEYSSFNQLGRHERFAADMEAFERRAEESSLGPQEVAEVYRQLSRILDGGEDAPLDNETRLSLASQVLHNAAVPTDIRQNTNTCSVASLEARIYSRQPSAAAALVADIATTGQYVGEDGTRVRLDKNSLTPSLAGTINLNEESDSRSFASQLFQVTAANIGNLNDPRLAHLQYIQIPQNGADTGERLINTGPGTPEIVDYGPGGAQHANGLMRVEESITGIINPDAYLVNAEVGGRRFSEANHFVDADHLGTHLSALSKRDQLPAVIFVNSDANLFNPPNQYQPEDLDGVSHFMTVVGYDPDSRTVRFDNQFEKEADNLVEGVPLELLYEATHVVTANERIDRLEERLGTARASERQSILGPDLEAIALYFSERWASFDQAGAPTNESPEERQLAVKRIIELAAILPQIDRIRIESYFAS